MAIAILAQGKSLELEREREHPAGSHSLHSNCMQQEEKEEQDPLFYDLSLSRLLSWNRWWHLTARVVCLVAGE